MTRTLTQPNSRLITTVVSFILSLFLVALVAQKLELQRMQSERDVAVTRASEFKLAFEQEHKKRTLQYMLLQSVATGKTAGTPKNAADAVSRIAAIMEPPVKATAQAIVVEPQLTTDPRLAP